MLRGLAEERGYQIYSPSAPWCVAGGGIQNGPYDGCQHLHDSWQNKGLFLPDTLHWEFSQEEKWIPQAFIISRNFLRNISYLEGIMMFSFLFFLLILEPRSLIFELTVAMVGYSKGYVAITYTSQAPGKQTWGLASSAILDVLLGEKQRKSHHWQRGVQRGTL